MAAPHEIVSPEGVLHLLPDEKRPMIDFAKAHGIRLDGAGGGGSPLCALCELCAFCARCTTCVHSVRAARASSKSSIARWNAARSERKLKI